MKKKDLISTQNQQTLSQSLRQLLEENVGNTMTPTLATGMLTLFNDKLIRMSEQNEQPKPAVK